MYVYYDLVSGREKYQSVLEPFITSLSDFRKKFHVIYWTDREGKRQCVSNEISGNLQPPRDFTGYDYVKKEDDSDIYQWTMKTQYVFQTTYTEKVEEGGKKRSPVSLVSIGIPRGLETFNRTIIFSEYKEEVEESLFEIEDVECDAENVPNDVFNVLPRYLIDNIHSIVQL